jgi:hypothetical protein
LRAAAPSARLGLEGIVSKRRGSRYARGRSSNWLKVKKPGRAGGAARGRGGLGAVSMTRDFISEDDLDTFEGWLKFQAVDPENISADQLAEWHDISMTCERQARQLPRSD